MTDVFTSYAREDREVASRLATRLEAERWTVFWDPNVLPGEEWRKVIETAVRDARCVVVLWSGASINSRWVQEEANLGIERNVLVPALLGPVKPPFGFDHCDRREPQVGHDVAAQPRHRHRAAYEVGRHGRLSTSPAGSLTRSTGQR